MKPDEYNKLLNNIRKELTRIVIYPPDTHGRVRTILHKHLGVFLNDDIIKETTQEYLIK